MLTLLFALCCVLSYETLVVPSSGLEESRLPRALLHLLVLLLLSVISDLVTSLRHFRCIGFEHAAPIVPDIVRVLLVWPILPDIAARCSLTVASVMPSFHAPE